MMTAQGIVFLSQTKPLATQAADGTFALTLLVFDRMGPHQVEPWRVTWSGPKAVTFWGEAQASLKPGQPLFLRAEKLRNFTVGGRQGAPEFVVTATHIDLAPLSTKRGAEAPACIRH